MKGRFCPFDAMGLPFESTPGSPGVLRLPIGAAIGALLVNLSGTLSPVVFGYAIQNSGYDFVFRGLGFAATLAFIGVMLLAWLVRQEPARS